MYAIIEVGGKSYKVENGQELLVDLMNKNNGDTIEFKNVTLYRDDKEIKIGTPYLNDVIVKGKVIEPLVKGEKLIIFKYKPKTGYRRKKGHRQKYTKIQITEIIKSATKESSKSKTA